MRSRRLGVAVLIVLLIGCGGAIYWIAGRPLETPPSDVDAQTVRANEYARMKAKLETLRLALAATEEWDPERADRCWAELAADAPKDPSLSLNLAINRVILCEKLSSDVLRDERRADLARARRELADAIRSARLAIARHLELSSDDSMALYLNSKVDLVENERTSDAKSMEAKIALLNRLSDEATQDLTNSDEVLRLAGLLTEAMYQVEFPVEGYRSELVPILAASYSRVSDLEPDCLQVALRAARLLIENKDEEAIRLVERVEQLSTKLDPLVAVQTARIELSPRELIDSIKNAIEANDWEEASRQNLMWFHTLTPYVNRRLLLSDPRTQLSFETLEATSKELRKLDRRSAGQAQISFQATAIARDVSIKSVPTTIVRALDYDFDLDVDLVVVTNDSVLQLWNNDGQANWTLDAVNSLDIGLSGLIVTDSLSSIPNGSSHLIGYGDEGVQILQVSHQESQTTLTQISGDVLRSNGQKLLNVTSAVALDFDSDSDLDVLFATKTGVRLFANFGDATFLGFDLTENRMNEQDSVADMAVVDLDQDFDLDVVTVHPESGKIGFIENCRYLRFHARYLSEVPVVKDVQTVEIEDLDSNGSWDMILGGEDTAIAFSEIDSSGSWKVTRRERNDHPSPHFMVADFDNDSSIDFITTGLESGKFSSLGSWGFGPWQYVKSVRADTFAVAEDLDGDGRVDLVTLRDGAPVVLINDSQGTGNPMQVRVSPSRRTASAPFDRYGIGTVVECRTGAHSRPRIVKSPVTHFGLGGSEEKVSVQAVSPAGFRWTIRGIHE